MFRPIEGIRKVFVSYYGSDTDTGLVGHIYTALTTIGFEPYIAEWSQDAGEYIRKKIADHILTSLHFIVILTKSGMNSQWVNQELGFAYALKHLNDIQKDAQILKQFPLLDFAVKNVVVLFNPIEIYPIVEKGVELKGFIDKSIEYIEFEPEQPDGAVYDLIPQIRTKTEDNYHTKLDLHVKCKFCNNEMTLNLPSREETHRAIVNNRLLVIKCESCKGDFVLSPFDFSVERDYR